MNKSKISKKQHINLSLDIDVIQDAKNRFANVSELVNRLLVSYLNDSASILAQNEDKLKEDLFNLELQRVKLNTELAIIDAEKKEAKNKELDIEKNKRLMEIGGVFSGEDNL
jgi:hypothetical protein